MARLAKKTSNQITTTLRSYPIVSLLLRKLTVFNFLKLILGLLLALNIRAFPLVWHLRAIRPIFYAGIRYQIVRLQHLFSDRQTRDIALENWVDSISPVGSHPFQFCTSFRSFASIDESDYNLHMSNSSYPKALDCAQLKAAVALFPQFLRVGGLIRLAETHFQFIKEIPILANYEVRVTIGSWDEKWLHVVCRFVTRKKDESSESDLLPDMLSSLPLKLRRPSRVVTPKSSTLFDPRISVKGESSLRTPDPEDMSRKMELRDITTKFYSTEEPDGAILHTVALTRVCFKMGRITVPPAIVLATNGLSRPPPPSLGGMSNPLKSSYSPSNPPPHWDIVKSIASKPCGGSLKAMQQFYRDGWKLVPKGEKWWEQALGGPVEQQRRERLELLSHVGMGMDSAREMRSGFGVDICV
ncbi:hypothetical protein K435DRAFT_964523 [Dendrothele bispora CBS 962.96]|uniref:Thioesterase/thiol ester dehydrase-isomerase n=1 Tax=Dendrothele bispora (strain CBS 962.96) TaxID=1314807 RepID=A0A4S8MA26_DENBC|nr:hypothetical protein K435DRAFT_964523 [Dendrothele bispora CBS 962.96]